MDMNYFRRRRMIQYLRQLLKEAQHVRNLREDIAQPKQLRWLDEAQKKVLHVLATRNWNAMDSAGYELENGIRQFYPKKPYSALRENIEIIVVAVAVAMAFRTYFIQPFKIPTSSMSPTLYGIHYAPKAQPDVFDRMPFKLIKWAVLGEWYVEIRAQATGIVRIEPTLEDRIMTINGLHHRVNKEMTNHVASGDRVFKGQLLASGIRITGDHIFVDKVSWNFRKPKRGEIMVFKTNGIDHPQIKKNEHYVKRLVGLPDETLCIIPPNIVINGQKITDAPAILRIESQSNGYDGYQIGGRDRVMASYLAFFTNNVNLGPTQYFACGDNQLNSLDSRYWGPVPKENLVGPAILVYWPFSRHWGITQ